MFSVALIGPDGSGKTTIANMLLESYPASIKYVYMGASIHSSNYSLPTSRLILHLKKRAYRKSIQRSDGVQLDSISTHQLEERNVERGKIWTTARVFNRLAEEWYRQFVVWSHQLRGHIVLCDRHFTFEFATKRMESRQAELPIMERFHLWCLYNLYPQPGLVLFLDAPPELLLQRKQEWTLAHLQRHRTAMLELGQQMTNFVCIDASQAIDRVYADVNEHMIRYLTTP